MEHKSRFFILMRNWISIVGLFLGTCAFVTGTFLLVLDMLTHFSNPYMGILVYMVAPALLAGSLFLVAIGMIRARGKMKRTGSAPPAPVIDFGSSRTIRRIFFFWIFSFHIPPRFGHCYVPHLSLLRVSGILRAHLSPGYET